MSSSPSLGAGVRAKPMTRVSVSPSRRAGMRASSPTMRQQRSTSRSRSRQGSSSSRRTGYQTQSKFLGDGAGVQASPLHAKDQAGSVPNSSR
jgi:hypothetical protein